MDTTVSRLVGEPRSFLARPTRVYERLHVSVPGIPRTSSGRSPDLVRWATTTELRLTIRFTELERAMPRTTLLPSLTSPRKRLLRTYSTTFTFEGSKC